VVAQCFLPRVDIAPTGARNELLIAPFGASFDSGKKHCGVLLNVMRNAAEPDLGEYDALESEPRMKILLLLICLLGPCFVSVQAQSIYLSIGGAFSSVNPTSNYTFIYHNDASPWPGRFEQAIGQKSDIGFTITSGIEFQLPSAPISLTAGISYAQLYGRTDSVRAYPPPWYSIMYITGELETRSNLLTIRTGATWQILRSQIAPYVSLELLYNIFGDTRLSIHNPYSTTEAVVDGNTRFGLSVGAGLRVSILPSIDASAGANYSLNNLVTPDTREEHKNMLSITASLYFKFL
jgi:opacity protein-like surface antigen